MPTTHGQCGEGAHEWVELMRHERRQMKREIEAKARDVSVDSGQYDWTAFDALDAPDKIDARRAILDGAGWRMHRIVRHATLTIVAWSPRDFVALWERGYR